MNSVDLKIKHAGKLQGKISVPGDKSISHRAIMLGSIASGVTEIIGFLKARDCLSTVECFRRMGVLIELHDDRAVVHGKGLYGLNEPEDILDVGNSGTTIRLISGMLAGQNFTSVLTGDSSIRRRPMGRVTKPLRQMGACILGRRDGSLAPIAIKGGKLKAISYSTPVASAQIKSAVLLAGLYADGWTSITEPDKSRNHTELMLDLFGARVEATGNTVAVEGGSELAGRTIKVPGDISSAAFFLAAGAILSDGAITVRDVGLNPTRTGIIDVLDEMGAKIRICKKTWPGNEAAGDITIESSPLKGIKIGGSIIPRLIDEIPVVTVLAACASGVTEIRDAAELKLKESNRLNTIAQELNKLGAKVEELPDGLRIYGGRPLTGAVCESHADHRIAMALAVAGLAARGETVIRHAEVIDISFPGFAQILEGLTGAAVTP